MNSNACYLAGPMRGYEMNNFPAFAKAARLLRESGYVVYNPAEKDIEAGLDPTNTDVPIEVIRNCLAIDFDLIIRRVQTVVLLPGWEHSIGAQMEVAIAWHLGRKLYEFLPCKEGKGYALVTLNLKQPLVQLERA